jgi:hypothetical protein
MTEIGTLGEKVTQRIFRIHNKTCISKFESTSVRKGGVGFRTLQRSNFEGSFSSESMELEKE